MMSASKSHKTTLLDKLAMALSGLCIAHCLANPIILILLPSLTTSLPENELLHLCLVCLASMLALIGILQAYKFKKATLAICVMVTGLAILWLGVFFHDPHWLEMVLTSIGATLTAVGHFMRNHAVASS